MASAAAAASGLRQQLCRIPSNPLLLSSSLRHNRQCRRPFSLPATLSFPSLSSHFPPPPPPPHSRPPYLSADAGSRRLLSSAASATRVHRSRRSVSMEEGDVEEEEDEDGEVFDVTSYDDDELAEEEEEEDAGEDGSADSPEFPGKMENLKLESPAAQDQQQLPRYPSPKLSVKEKKELAAYAHSLGTKLKSQQVGKSGITPSVVAAFIETLEANELLKLKVHGSCPGELPEVIDQLEASTGSVAVGRIGRSVILYRPSLSKMQKKEARSVKKTWRPTPKEQAGGLKLQKKRPLQRLSGRRSSSSSSSGAEII